MQAKCWGPQNDVLHKCSLLGVISHIVPGGTDKSNGGDYENRLWYVKFGGLAILKP